MRYKLVLIDGIETVDTFLFECEPTIRSILVCAILYQHDYCQLDDDHEPLLYRWDVVRCRWIEDHYGPGLQAFHVENGGGLADGFRHPV